MVARATSPAERFAELFPEVYLRLRARRERSAQRVTPQSRALLQHLAMSGPLTVTELATHVERAQSVVSETIDVLTAKGLVERMTDPRDRRRSLVWLTDDGLAFLAHERELLDEAPLARAMDRLTPAERSGLIEGMAALVRACDALADEHDRLRHDDESNRKRTERR